MKAYEGNNRTVKARNYQEAAEKLFGQTYYENPATGGLIPTTYVVRHNGYAIVKVYCVGDKQGAFWGVKQAVPMVYTIKRVK